jgi:hypothetical protein
MGNKLSTSTPPSLLSQQKTKLDTRPTSLAKCIDDKGLKAIQFFRYRQRFSDESNSSAQFLDSVLPPEATAIAIVEPPKKHAKKGSVFDYMENNGELVSSTPTTLLWYKMYVTNDTTKLRGKHK